MKGQKGKAGRGEPCLGFPPSSEGSDRGGKELKRVTKGTITTWTEMHCAVTSDNLSPSVGKCNVKWKSKKKKRSKEKNKVHTKQTANVGTVLRQPAGRRPGVWGGHPAVPLSHCPMPGQAVGPPVPSRHSLCWLHGCCKATEGCGRRRA